METIVILGAGFAGIRTALDLDKKVGGRAKIILIDKNSYHLFTPALYEVATAYGLKKDPHTVKLRETITIPISDIINGRQIDFIQTEISSLDLASFNYSYLVIALGSQAFDFNIRGVREYGFQFKTLEDGLMIHDKIETLFNEALRGKKSFPLKIIVCGGGFTGVEFAAEAAMYLKKLSSAKGLNRKSYQINLCEASPKIIPMINEKARQSIIKRLTGLGVVVTTNSQIEEVGSESIKLKDGRKMAGDMIVWTAGTKACSFLESMGTIPLTPQMKAVVDSNLRVKGFNNIFSAGDCVEFINPESHKPIPATAYTAIEQAKVVARNILNLMAGKKLIEYRPSNSPRWIIPVGGKFAVAILGENKVLKGIGAWVLRELVNLRYLISILPISKALSLFKTDMTVFTKND